MTSEEFIKKLRELDPFYTEPGKEISLDDLYSRMEIVVTEMERLEDIEDETVMMLASIDKLEQDIKTFKQEMKELR